MARLRAAPSAQIAPPTAQKTRQALKEKTNNALPKAPVYENDGYLDELVKPTRSRRSNTKKSTQDGEVLLMSGGLQKSGTERHTLLPTEQPTTTDELAKSDEQPPPPSAKPTKRPPRMTRKAIQTQAKSEEIPDMKKRTLANTGKTNATKKTLPLQKSGAASNATAAPIRSPAVQEPVVANLDRSEFSLSPSPPPAGKLSAIKDKSISLIHGSSKKAQSTPAAESSILALKNFKRRPRQPSMLQMVQQRTASARPSAVHLPSKDDPTVYDIVDDIEDDDAFAPDAEGTPQRLRAKPRLSAGRHKTTALEKSSPAVQPAAQPAPSVTRKRKSNAADLASSALNARTTKRQKSTNTRQSNDSDAALLTSVPDTVLQSNIPDGALLTSGPIRSSSSLRRVTPRQQITSDPQAISSEPSTTPPTDPPSDLSRNNREESLQVSQTAEEEENDLEHINPTELDGDAEQDLVNGTMAEPASSSPLPSPRAGDHQAKLTAELPNQTSPSMKRGGMKKSKAKPMTTETLQSLLPKRRQPRKRAARVSEYDIESDSDQDKANGEAERGAKVRRQTKTAKPTRKKASIAPKSKSLRTKAVLANRESQAPQRQKFSAHQAASRKLGKTYGRTATTTSDKENEGENPVFESLDENEESTLPDTSISMYEAAHSKELEAARKMFAEVDDWDMEFESMSVEEGRSSSQEWR